MTTPPDDALARDIGMLRAILSDYQDVISGPDVQRGIDATDSLRDELQRLREERDAARFQANGWRAIAEDASGTLFVKRAEAAEVALAARTHQLGRAEIDNWHLRRALEETLADDGNCTADEPQDPHCPRCKACRVLEALVTAVRVQAEREPGSLDTAIRRALAAADGTPKDTT